MWLYLLNTWIKDFFSLNWWGSLDIITDLAVFSLLPIGFASPLYVDQKNCICRLLWKGPDEWCFRHPKRHRSWSYDLHVSLTSWWVQGSKLSWMGNKVRFLLVLLWDWYKIIKLLWCPLSIFHVIWMIPKYNEGMFNGWPIR